MKEWLLLGCCLASLLSGCSFGDPAYVPPLASEAKAKPDPRPDEVKAARDKAERVRYSVMIGSHDFDGLDREADELFDLYKNKKISADEWILRLFRMVPLASDQLQLPDLIAWTKAKPNSYAAWYVLGRQYVHLAESARGGKWASETSSEEFEQMDKFGRLAREALLKSVPLNPRPLPSYRTLIQADNFTDSTDKASELGYLKKAIEADPDATIPYTIYFGYNTPRWGGEYAPLYQLIEQAKHSGLMSPKNIRLLEADLLVEQAMDVADRYNEPTRAGELYVEAYEKSPEPENIRWLYYGAYELKKAHKIDRAIEVYTKIIKVRPSEYEAYFDRGVLYRTEKKDIPREFADEIASAKLGYMYAQNNVGYFYLTGDHGFPIDLHQAKAWLTLAANQGLQHSKDKLPLVEAKLAAEAAREGK